MICTKHFSVYCSPPQFSYWLQHSGGLQCSGVRRVSGGRLNAGQVLLQPPQSPGAGRAPVPRRGGDARQPRHRRHRGRGRRGRGGLGRVKTTLAGPLLATSLRPSGRPGGLSVSESQKTLFRLKMKHCMSVRVSVIEYFHHLMSLTFVRPIVTRWI